MHMELAFDVGGGLFGEVVVLGAFFPESQVFLIVLQGLLVFFEELVAVSD